MSSPGIAPKHDGLSLFSLKLAQSALADVVCVINFRMRKEKEVILLVFPKPLLQVKTIRIIFSRRKLRILFLSCFEDGFIFFRKVPDLVARNALGIPLGDVHHLLNQGMHLPVPLQFRLVLHGADQVAQYVRKAFLMGFPVGIERLVVIVNEGALKVFYRSLRQAFVALVIQVLVQGAFLVGAKDHGLAGTVYVADRCVGIQDAGMSKEGKDFCPFSFGGCGEFRRKVADRSDGEPDDSVRQVGDALPCFFHGDVVVIVEEKGKRLDGGAVVYAVDDPCRKGGVEPGSGDAVAVFVGNEVLDGHDEADVDELLDDGFARCVNVRIADRGVGRRKVNRRFCRREPFCLVGLMPRLRARLSASGLPAVWNLFAEGLSGGGQGGILEADVKPSFEFFRGSVKHAYFCLCLFGAGAQGFVFRKKGSNPVLQPDDFGA